MWSAHSEHLSNTDILKIKIHQGASPVSLDQVLRGWVEDGDFRSFFNDLLAESPFADFRWETPPSTTASLRAPFEFVLVNSPGLARVPDATAFAEHFRDSVTGVVSFRNLGKDSLLVVSCPIAPPTAYRHIGSFVREAPKEQKHSLWKTVAMETAKAIGSIPIWLNTAGAGVSWLHVRIDQKPKYYVHGPYQKF